MKITTAWVRAGATLRMVAARQTDNRRGVADYEDAIDHCSTSGIPFRELVIEVPDEAVRALFDVPEVEGKVTG